MGLCIFLSCEQRKENKNVVATKPVFELIDPAKSKLLFENTVTNTESFNIFNYRNFYNGGGVAIGDINNDGLPDVYLTANMGDNKLFLNKGEFIFDDITGDKGLACENNWSTGVVMVDINNDHYLDIYVCNAGLNESKTGGQKNKLFINNKNLTFTEAAAQYGLDEDGYTTHVAFFDYDKDGDLDVYILNNSFIPVNTLNYSNKRELRAKDWPVKDFLKGGGDKLLRNDKNKFVDVSEKSGIYGSLIGFGLGVNIGDLNGDDWPDIFVSNDFFEKDYMYINQRNGTFKEDIENRVTHLSMSSMGADIADINNDGHPEIFTTDMLPYTDTRLKTTSSYDNIDVQKLRRKQGFYDQYMQNTLQYNNGDGTFSEIAQYSGVAASDWSWGALMFDADNDMFNDIFVCNGIYKDVIDQDFIDFFASEVYQKMAISGEKSKMEEIINQMPSNPIQNVFFRNNGNLTFNNSSNTFGFSQKTFSNGAAYGDLDNDGDLDLIVNNLNQPCMLYRNNLDTSHFIRLRLKGNSLNTFAVGAKIKVYMQDKILFREVIPSRGFQSSVDYTQTIGLGNRQTIDSVWIEWPDDKISILISPSIDTVWNIDYTSSKKNIKSSIKRPEPPLLIPDSVSFSAHIENEYIDFYTEPNLPMMLSREGPAVAKADVDHNGLEDIFVGGAKGQVSVIYLQYEKGKFRKDTTKVFDRFTYFEDVSAEFVDVDQNGSMDLIVGSGGNESDATDLELVPRLFINDGKGGFKVENRLPRIYADISVIKPWDFDQDGDPDLFMGVRNKHKVYGLAPDSYLLENDGKGYFTIYGGKDTEFSHVGCIRDAVIVDVNNDKLDELIVVGDWMSPIVFQYKNKLILKINTNLSSCKGLFGAVFSVDIDADGDQDLVLGNMGLNYNLQADVKNPIKLYIKDFDKNGLIDKVMTKTVEGRDKPVFLKREIIQQIVSLKKQNLKHATYSEKSIQDLFSDTDLKDTKIMEVNELRSVIALNQGNTTFEIRPLPAEVQWSAVNCISSMDIDQDGYPEIVLGGNNYNLASNFTKQDGNHGIILKWNKDAFESIPVAKTGFRIQGEAKKMMVLNKDLLITFINDAKPYAHKLNK